MTALWRRRGGRVEILLTRRPAGVHLEGRWELPGGKVLPGESTENAARRDLAQETGATTRRLESYSDRSVAASG